MSERVLTTFDLLMPRWLHRVVHGGVEWHVNPFWHPRTEWVCRGCGRRWLTR